MRSTSRCQWARGGRERGRQPCAVKPFTLECLLTDCARPPKDGSRAGRYREGMHEDDTLRRFEASRHRGSGIEPLDSYVLIEPVEDETETTAGLIIPASTDSACSSGVVVAVGEEAHGVSPGDKVLYPRDAGFEIRLSGEPKRLVSRHELIARIVD